MRLFNIWQTPEAGLEPSKVNGKPVLALSFDQAVTLHQETAADAGSYRRRPDGSWIYGNARLFENRSDAQFAGRQAA
jgi:hypothetical protein